MLYNQSVWHNYFYSSFNFKYSTSGNMFITQNSWDLRLSNGRSGKMSFSVPITTSEIGQVVDLGEKYISSVELTDFPDPNTYKKYSDIDVIKGHTYAVYHYKFNDENFSSIFGAVQVVDIDPTHKWAQLKFRRIKIGAADYFQKWVNLPVPQEIQKVVLKKTENGLTADLYPFINKRGDQSSYYDERISFKTPSKGPDYLSRDCKKFCVWDKVNMSFFKSTAHTPA